MTTITESEKVPAVHAAGPRSAALGQRAAAVFPDARLTAADTRPIPLVMARGAGDRIGPPGAGR